MNAAPLVLAWLVLAHLLADFVFQTEGVAIGKFGNDRRAWRALAIHVGIVGLLNLPLIVVFGVPGAAFAAGGHGRAFRHRSGQDRPDDPPRRWRTGLAGSGRRARPCSRTRPCSRARIRSPERRHRRMRRERRAAGTAGVGGPALDRAWTPRPAALFIADQLAHVAVLVGAWAILLAGAAPVGSVGRLRQPAARQRRIRRRSIARCWSSSCWRTLRSSTFERRRCSSRRSSAHRAPGWTAERPRGHPSEARIGATIGVLERIIVAALTLASALDAIGLVVAAKTLARFRQLDDREFAEYYLLGTLASISVAIISSLVARQALA